MRFNNLQCERVELRKKVLKKNRILSIKQKVDIKVIKSRMAYIDSQICLSLKS